jgi:radical SAM superfamily enzyme
MGNSVKICQSCAMPMSKDPQDGGTNADGSRNEKYCSYCYKDGTFGVSSDMSLEEFQEYERKAMIEHAKINKFVAWFFTRKMFLKNLERWKNN